MLGQIAKSGANLKAEGITKMPNDTSYTQQPFSLALLKEATLFFSFPGFYVTIHYFYFEI